MAQQSSNGQKKRGPGRPPGSKNKPKNTGSATAPAPTKQEVLDEMKRRSDRDRRNLDVIWSITLFAVAVFLFFTVVMDSTGSLGMKVHDLCKGLFGSMAYVLPFLVLIFAVLLFAGKLSHIGLRTTIFSMLIFINLCILNSYRFIDPYNLRYGFADIADYYILGVRGEMGGVIGMEIGSLLAKLFGMPGLLIISIAVLLISVFLVANSPISRFFDGLGRKAEAKQMEKELEQDEREKVSQLPGGSAAVTSEAPRQPFWKSIFSSITGEDKKDQNAPAGRISAEDIPKPFSAARRDADIDYTQIVPSVSGDAGSQGRNTRAVCTTLSSAVRSRSTGTLVEAYNPMNSSAMAMLQAKTWRTDRRSIAPSRAPMKRPVSASPA